MQEQWETPEDREHRLANLKAMPEIDRLIRRERASQLKQQPHDVQRLADWQESVTRQVEVLEIEEEWLDEPGVFLALENGTLLPGTIQAWETARASLQHLATALGAEIGLRWVVEHPD